MKIDLEVLFGNPSCEGKKYSVLRDPVFRYDATIYVTQKR